MKLAFIRNRSLEIVNREEKSAHTSVYAYPSDEPMKNKHTEVIVNVIESFVRHLFIE